MKIKIKDLGCLDWKKTSESMKIFTKNRTSKTIDELWFAEHFPIFTYGLSIEHISFSEINDIPILKSDRGGNITYHGPGQLLIYLLLDLYRKKIKLHKFIQYIQKIVIYVLRQYNIKSHILKKKPGVYVDHKKISSIGLRIIKGCSLYGFSFNIKMNLTPFQYISPCGDKTLKMTQLYNFKENICFFKIKQLIVKKFIKLFQYSKIIFIKK